MTVETLQVARKHRGWTQAEAALRLGISQTYVALLEKGLRPVPDKLAQRVVRVFDLSPELLPVSGKTPSAVTADELARDLGRLGYPGFAYLRRARSALKNPAEVLLAALARPNLESRIAEGLPWLVLSFPSLDARWLVTQARLLNITNRVGFVVDLARSVAKSRGEIRTQRYQALTSLSEGLRAGRLEAEDTLAQDSLSKTERNWLRANRPAEAEAWHILSDWRPELLQFV